MAQDTEKNDSVQVIDMNRTFSVGGRALLCLRSAEASRKDVKALSWTLTNNPVGDQNFVHLEVKNAKTDKVEAFQSWNGGVQVTMKKKSDGKITYEVYDDTFMHLRIVELNNNGIYIILLYSELLK
jgi:hypothetical protein